MAILKFGRKFTYKPMTEKSALRTMAEKSYGKVHGNLVRDPMLTNGGKVSIALNGGKVFGKFQRKIRRTRLEEQNGLNKTKLSLLPDFVNLEIKL